MQKRTCYSRPPFRRKETTRKWGNRPLSRGVGIVFPSGLCYIERGIHWQADGGDRVDLMHVMRQQPVLDEVRCVPLRQRLRA